MRPPTWGLVVSATRGGLSCVGDWGDPDRPGGLSDGGVVMVGVSSVPWAGGGS